MRKLHVAAFVSLDGVMQAPGGPEEDRSGGFAHGGWVVPKFDEALGEEVDRFFAPPRALLLGRKTYEIFAAHWPHQNDAFADALNAMPKYVATRSPRPLAWNNSHPIGPDAVSAVRALKAEAGPDLLTQGSSGLIQSLLKADLVDQFTLLIFPVVLGSGKRLFHVEAAPAGLRLLGSRTTSQGVVVARYERAGDVSSGSFARETPSEDEVKRRADINGKPEDFQ
ncbi:dihydrofolate reductase family protein [Brevundimonas sp.]|uniref:dihydrofolate reductase family protein n=1 Tax=Brevundimonas sp. TaxID=1871086 RepID=UPI001DAE6D05|nr:dihydrofolate reductase family protein [Brevundimonas sp.]MBA3999755.1 dihydrofolate reductase [Brevundimonas sp.]